MYYLLICETDNPVTENDGDLRSCGNMRWCCEPDVTRGTCDCETGKGTFEVRDGKAQSIVGMTGLQRTATDAVLKPTAAVESSTLDSKPGTRTQASRMTSITLESPARTSFSGPPGASTSMSIEEAPSPTSLNSLPSSTGSTTAAPRPDNHITIIAAVVTTVGVAVFLTLGLIACFRWYKRRRSSPGPGHPYHGQTHHTEADEPTNSPNTANVVQSAVAPSPHPYSEAFPTRQTVPPGSAVPANRSRLNMGIIPDHDPQWNQHPDLGLPQAIDPFEVPNPPSNAFENQRHYWLNRPPIYRTQAPSHSPR